MDSTSSDFSYRSRYGIEKLQDHNYHTWSFQCQMLLSEKEVWSVISQPRPKKLDEYTDEQVAALSAADKRGIQNKSDK